MKKLLIVLMLFVAFAACGQETVLYKDDFTILYNEPADLPDVLSGESIVYRIYLWDMADGEPTTAMGPSWCYYAETPTLAQYVVTPPDPRTGWAVGIQSVFIRADLTEFVSRFAHTMNAVDVDPLGDPGVPFFYALDSETPTIGPVQDLRDSGM